MNIKRWIAATGICLSFVLFGLQSAAYSQTRVALVDIGAVFKSHPQFSASLEELKNQADMFQQESQRLEQQLVSKAEGLNRFEKDTDEYADLEAELAKESATLEVDQRAKMRNLLKQEAMLHFDTYVEISEVVSDFCTENGIQLVLRFNRNEIDSRDPGSIMEKVNGGIVFRDGKADITDEIVQRVVAKARSASNGTVRSR